MGRRKQEPRSVHRETITTAASALFEKKGITATSMDEIAKAAGYSKTTLYVYFENKEEIIGILALKSMRKLDDALSFALEYQEDTRAKYDFICRSLVQYQERFPFYFQMVLDKLTFSLDNQDCPAEEKETYQVGEAINQKLTAFLKDGIEKGDLRQEINDIPTIFSIWGMLSGLIQLAANKETYIKHAMGLEKDQFLRHGFDMLYRSMVNREDE